LIVGLLGEAIECTGCRAMREVREHSPSARHLLAAGFAMSLFCLSLTLAIGWISDIVTTGLLPPGKSLSIGACIVVLLGSFVLSVAVTIRVIAVAFRIMRRKRT